MKIYEFSTWGSYNELFKVEEIEVEEKPKSYVGKYNRILKTDIDRLQGHYGNRMYRLTNDSDFYISEVIKRIRERVEGMEKALKGEKERLSEWEALKGGAE